MRRTVRFPALVLLAFLLSASCAPEASPAPASPAGPKTAATSRASWELEWEKVVAEAKKEKTVVVYSIMGASQREALQKGIKDKYGVDLEFVVGRGTELLARARAERTAGLYQADAVMGGATTMKTFKEAGFLDPIETAIILPDVKDPANWAGGRFPFFDKDRYTMAFLRILNADWAVNTQMVRPEEVGSYRDLLDPKWKGKMTLLDPSITGAGNLFINTAAWELMGEDYVRALAKQDLVITPDSRLHTESVARGKYAIGLGPDFDILGEFKRAGAPVKEVHPKEGGAVGAGTGGFGVFSRPGHPNAARLFVNWFLSREGQTVIARATDSSSVRADVPVDHVNPDRLPAAGVKYVLEDEEIIRLRGERQLLSKEIFGIR